MTVMSKSKRVDGWWYPWIFVAGFGVVIAVNGTMAYIAVDTWTGLETAQPFQKAQAFNGELAQKSAQAALDWTVKVDFVKQPTTQNARAGILHFTVLDAHDQGIGGLTIEAQAVRPTHEGYDQVITFEERGLGEYVAPADLPLPGQWELRITASRADDIFKLRQRILVP